MADAPTKETAVYQAVEATQALGNYVLAAKLRLRDDPANIQLVADLLERAARELGRTFDAIHQLRALLAIGVDEPPEPEA